MPSAVEIVIRGTNATDKAINEVKASFGGLGTSAVAMGAAIGMVYEQIGAKALEATKQVVMGFAEAGAQIDILHQRTGMSTEAISALSEAAKLTGTTIEGLDVGIKKMNQTVFAAAEGNGKATATLTELGLKVSDLKGLKPDEMFVTMADSLAKVDSAGARSALSVALFGKAGQQLLPMLASGKLDLAAWEDLTKKLGLSFDKDAAEGARKFHDQTILLGGQIDGLKYKIGEALMPAVSDLVTQFQHFIDQNGATVAANIATAAGNAANAVHSMAHAWAEAGNVLQKMNSMGISNNTLLWGALGGKIGGPLGALALGGAAAAIGTGNNLDLNSTLLRIGGMTAAGAGAGFLAGGVGAPVGAAVGFTVASLSELLAHMNHADLLGNAIHAPGEIDPATGAPYGAGTFGPNAPDKPFFDLSKLLGDKNTDDGGFNAPPGGGSSKKSPLEDAWKKIQDDLTKQLIDAWQKGGAGAAAIQKQHNDIILQQTTDLAERMVQALGVDMAPALLDSFASVTDAAKATADELQKAAASQQKFNDEVAGLVKTMDDAVRKNTAALFGQLTANRAQSTFVADPKSLMSPADQVKAWQQAQIARDQALLATAKQASVNDAVNNASLSLDGSNAAQVLAAIAKVTQVNVQLSPDLALAPAGQQ